jgi:hypothetical protein
MAAKSSVIQVEPDLAQAFNAAPKRAQERAKSAMRNILKIVAPELEEKALSLSKKESELLVRINRGLSPGQRSRLAELTDKMEYESITDAEHEELLRLTRQMEKKWVEQLQAVTALARLRKVSLDEMLTQLGKQPGTHAR